MNLVYEISLKILKHKNFRLYNNNKFTKVVDDLIICGTLEEIQDIKNILNKFIIVMFNNCNSFKSVNIRKNLIDLRILSYSGNRFKFVGKYNTNISDRHIILKDIEALNHEFMHLFSHDLKESNENYSVLGFCCINHLEKKSIGRGINEGYTQYLSKKYFDIKIDCYDFEQSVMMKIEEILGTDLMEKLYFSANLRGLIEELKQYITEEEIYEFIHCMDKINIGNMKNKENYESEKIKIESFLEKCRQNKLLICGNSKKVKTLEKNVCL